MSTDEGKPDAERKSDAGKISHSHTDFAVQHPGRDWALWEVKVSAGRKTERLSARMTADQVALIRYAAEIEGTDLTNFTVTTLLARALDVLADRKLFILDDAAWTEFQALLDAPVSHKPRLEKLFSEPTIFDTRPKP